METPFALHTQTTNERPRWSSVLKVFQAEPLKMSPVQLVANELAQELKVYNFGLQKNLCEPQDLELSMERFNINPPQNRLNFVFVCLKGRQPLSLKRK